MKWVRWVCAVLIGCAVTPSVKPSSSPQQAVAVVGDDVTLPCPLRPPLNTAEVARVVTVVWKCEDKTVLTLRGGKELLKEKDKKYKDRTAKSEDGSLKLFKVKRYDTKTYRCSVRLSEPNEEREASVSLHVGEPSVPLLSIRHHEDGQLFLHCESSGWPLEPEVSWLDIRGHAHQATSNKTTRQPDGLYSITQRLDVAKDNETFICRVQIQNLMKEIKLHVTDSYPRAQGDTQGSSTTTIIGSVVAVAVVAILCVVWFYVRKTQKENGAVRNVDTVEASARTANENHLESRGAEDESDSSRQDNVQQRMLGTDNRSEGADSRDDTDINLTEFGDIMNVDTIGVSEKTANKNGLKSGGVEASGELASRDLADMEKYKHTIISVGNKFNIHPALIAAIISRQTRFGKLLDTHGWGKEDPKCWGLMQIHKGYHPLTGSPYSKEHVEEGTTILVQGIKQMSRKRENSAWTKRTEKDWTKEMELKGGIAAYMASVEDVAKEPYEDIDKDPRHGDFANDVVARAQWFIKNGHF